VWDSVHLVLDTILAIITAGLVFRQDVLRFLHRRSVMKKEWEPVLGQMVLFTEEAPGRWKWECPTLSVEHSPEVRFSSQSAARVMAATMVFAYFVTEEATGEPVPPATELPPVSPVPLVPPLPRPPQGSGGRR